MMQGLGIEELPEFDFPEFRLPDIGGLGLDGLRLPELALAGGGTTTTTNNNQRTINMGGIYLTVNGYNVQDDDALASMVANKINEMLDEDGSVFK